MILRVGMRLYFGAPMLSNKVPSIIKVLGKISHLALYLLVIAMPITGLLGWYVDSGTVLPIHKGLSNVLLSLILIHICAVGFHEGVLGSSLIRRMVAFNTKLKK
jgi:cytochrome b561